MNWKLLLKVKFFPDCECIRSLYASTYNAVCSPKELIMLSGLSWCRPRSVYSIVLHSLCTFPLVVCTEALHCRASCNVITENQSFQNICMKRIAIKFIWEYYLSLLAINSTKMFIGQQWYGNKCTLTLYYIVCARKFDIVCRDNVISIDLHAGPLSSIRSTWLHNTSQSLDLNIQKSDSERQCHFVSLCRQRRHSWFIYYKPTGEMEGFCINVK